MCARRHKLDMLSLNESIWFILFLLLLLYYIDEPVLRAMRHLFNNRFMKAKRLFERDAKT